MAKKALGRGLSALIPAKSSNGAGSPGDFSSGHVVEIPVNRVIPNPQQPRKNFAGEKIEELALSLKEHGILQPLVVVKVDEGYQIVVGERRWRAAKRAGIASIPAVVRNLSPEKRVALALVENLQREDLNALEEAEAFQLLVENFGFTQETVSRQVGKSRPYITNTLRLLNLPGPVKSLVADGKLSPGHARAILSIPDPSSAVLVAERVVNDALSVRQTEDLVKKKARAEEDPRVRVVHPLEKELTRALGTRVKIKVGRTGGRLEISYRNLKDLEALAARIARSSPNGRSTNLSFDLL